MIVISARGCRLFRMPHDELRNLNLGAFRASGKILDGMPVGIPRAEVHLAKVASIAKGLVYQVRAFEKSVPIKLGSPSHARDDVAHCYAHRCLLLMFGAHNVVRGSALGGQAFVQPQKNGTDLWIQVSQPLNQLNGKGPIERLLLKLAKGRGWRQSRLTACAQKRVGKLVGLVTRLAAEDDSTR